MLKPQLALVLDLAMPVITALPLAARADAFDGISLAWQFHDETLSKRAADAAAAIRQAETSQLLFRELLASVTQPKGAES